MNKIIKTKIHKKKLNYKIYQKRSNAISKKINMKKKKKANQKIN